MATIGVTRGLGDHDLKVHDSNIYIKPFLSSAPEVPHAVYVSVMHSKVFSDSAPPMTHPRPDSGRLVSRVRLEQLPCVCLPLHSHCDQPLPSSPPS